MTLIHGRSSFNSISFKFLENDRFQDTRQSEFKEAKEAVESSLFKKSLYNCGNKESKAASPLHLSSQNLIVDLAPTSSFVCSKNDPRPWEINFRGFL
ncbi:hypothetical protein LguiB_030360 [Lonicera macranthoides]